jgi:hypothetical protein
VADDCSGSDRPPAEAFSDLWAGLREAKRRFKTGQDAGRDGAIHAVESVLKFLQRFDPVQSEALQAPLARLFDDLMSLDDGVVSNMLTPRKKRGRGRVSGFYDSLKGVAVFTVLRLAANEISLPQARAMVAGKLAELGIRPARKGSRDGTGRFSERTLRKWQEDIRFNKTATDTLSQLEAGHLTEVLEGFRLSALPTGSTADDLLRQRFRPAQLWHVYLDKMTEYIANTRSQETT